MTLVSLSESLTPRLDFLEGLKIFSYFSSKKMCHVYSFEGSRLDVFS